MRTLKTDNGDIALDSRGNLSFIDELQSLAKRVGQKLKLIKGEWVLDLTEGLPYFETKFNMNGSVDNAMLVINKAVLEFREVTAIKASSGFVDRATRIFTYSMVVDTIYGEMEITNG